MSDRAVRQLEKTMDLPLEEMKKILNAMLSVYPMIVYCNLTRNTYTMLRNDRFLYNDVMSSGRYDDLIDENVENIHSNYQALFLDCFSRERLLKSFQEGKTEIYAELHQKNKEGAYCWVSTQVIKVEDTSGDVCHLCLNRVIDGIVKEKHSHRK
jgi:hypothetical protein